jgi:hypothetical protein
MRLPEKDVRHFYELYNSFLFYVNKKYGILKDISLPEDILNSDPIEINKLKDKLYGEPELLDSYLEENPSKFSVQDLQIVANWKNFVKGRFFILRHLKNYTIFLDESTPPKAYGVLALVTPFEVMIGQNPPILVETVLLPFENRIVYDGTILPYRVFFGSGFRKDLSDRYNQAKLSYGIITTLPFAPESIETKDSDMLRIYLKTEHSRDIHYQEIDELLEKNPDLLPIYHEEMGRVHARTYRKRLKSIGISEGWFALLEGIIIASGKSHEDVERVLKTILPAEKMKFVYVFQLK